MQSPMWPYCGKNLGIWRCPADRSYVTFGGVQKAADSHHGHERLSGGLLRHVLIWETCPTYTIYRKYSELSPPGPDRIFLLIDEREDAINYGNFLTDMVGYSPNGPGSYALLDLPASYHGQAGGLSFCDGHSEIHRWRDSRTMPPVRRRSYLWGRRHRDFVSRQQRRRLAPGSQTRPKQ